MTNRTVQIKGYGFGATPASVTATFNGTQIFSGDVPTTNQPIPILPDDTLNTETQVLFTFEIPMGMSGNIPMSLAVDGNPVIFAQINANYANLTEVVGNVTTYYSSGAAEFPIISGPDTRNNIVIDGVPQPESLEAGCTWITIYPESTLTYDLYVVPGLE